MTKLFASIAFLLVLILLIASFESSQASLSKSHAMADMAEDQDETSLDQERREYDLHKLRHFLLTADAEQRAAKREQQEFYKRELIREYLQSLTDPDPDRYQEVRKRFKTYCNSYEDLMNSNWATCG